jgi:hypothetical protein
MVSALDNGSCDQRHAFSQAAVRCRLGDSKPKPARSAPAAMVCLMLKEFTVQMGAAHQGGAWGNPAKSTIDLASVEQAFDIGNEKTLIYFQDRSVAVTLHFSYVEFVELWVAARSLRSA